METIVPCRSNISERFPIASFLVRVSERRYYEVVCATDPRLLHTDHAARRSPSNFYSSRGRGLLPAGRSDDAFIVPPDQLRRFAGARRIYYALASYGGRGEEDPRFSIAPTALDRVPSIGLSADFTGRTLDRARLGERKPTAVYGRASGPLRWGGDVVFEAQRRAETRRAVSGQLTYDDGYDAELWRGQSADLAQADYRNDGNVGVNEPDVRPSADAQQPSGERELEDGAQAYGFRARPVAFRGRPRIPGLALDTVPDAEPDDEASRDAASAEIEDVTDYYARHPGDQSPTVPVVESSPESATSYEDGADYYRHQPSHDPTAEREAGVVAGRYGAPTVPSYRGPASARGRSGSNRRAVGGGRHQNYREEDQPEQMPVGPAARSLGATPLTIEAKVRILRVIGRSESGDGGYSAVNPDTEYADPNHSAYNRYHIGLSWGFIQFTQRSGALGSVLERAKARDAALRPSVAASSHDADQPPSFEALFGPDWEELLERTDSNHTPNPDDRVAAVAGTVLWEEPWLDRFIAAGQVPYVQAAQNEAAIQLYFDPMLSLARWLGIRSARGLALLVDRAIHMGVGEGRAEVMRAVGVIRTQAEREQALAALGFSPTALAEFQAQQPGLTSDGKWGALTHAALISALRALGDASPVPVPSPEQTLQSLIDAVTATSYAARTRALINNQTDFDDAVTFELTR